MRSPKLRYNLLPLQANIEGSQKLKNFVFVFNKLERNPHNLNWYEKFIKFAISV